MSLLSPSLSFLGHRHWVLSISWSPDGKKLASGCKNGQVDGGQGNLAETLGLSSWELGQNLQGGRGGRKTFGGAGTGWGRLFGELLSLDSPVGPKHRKAGGQDLRWPQQVDHRLELGAPPCVSDTDSWSE